MATDYIRSESERLEQALANLHSQPRSVMGICHLHSKILGPIFKIKRRLPKSRLLDNSIRVLSCIAGLEEFKILSLSWVAENSIEQPHEPLVRLVQLLPQLLLAPHLIAPE